MMASDNQFRISFSSSSPFLHQGPKICIPSENEMEKEPTKRERERHVARGRKMRMNREDFEEEKPKMAHACHAMPLLSVRTNVFTRVTRDPFRLRRAEGGSFSNDIPKPQHGSRLQDILPSQNVPL